MGQLGVFYACTVKPLLKDTPEFRTPLYKGHFATCVSQIRFLSTPEMRTLLYTGTLHQVPKVSTVEGFLK